MGQQFLLRSVPKAAEEKFDAMFPNATMVTGKKEGQ